MYSSITKKRLLHPILTRSCFCSLTALAAVTVSTATLAQTPILEELIITATKRVDLIHDVPIAIQAVSGEKIAEAGILNLEELTLYTPAVTVNKGYASANLFIRGVGSGTNSGFEQSVGLYIDDVYSGRGQLSRVPLTMDLQHIEVLKGPQGILFGKNTIGGAISVTSARPTDEFEGYVDVIYEPEDGEQVLTGVVSGGLTDNLSARLAMRYEGMDGWWENKQLNTEGPDKDNLYTRLGLSWTPTDSIEVYTKYEHGDFEVVNLPAVVYQSDQPLNFEGDSPFPIIDDVETAAMDFADTDDTTTDVLAVNVNWDLEDFSIVSVTSYSTYETLRFTNADFSATSALHRRQDEEFSQLSQELRIVSPGSETFDWITGLYFQKSELDIGRTNSPLDFALNGPLAVPALIGTVPQQASIYEQESNSWAVFGQGTYSFDDTVRLTLGLRYNKEKKDLDKQTFAEGLGARLTDLGLPNNIVFANADGLLIADLRSHEFRDVSREEDKVTWSSALQWDATDDTMLYISASTGYKGGGFDESYTGAGPVVREAGFDGVPTGGTVPGNDASVLNYDEETVIAYELGAKMSLADGAAELNMALFRMEYDDLQVSSLVGDVFTVGNAGESISQGFEIDGRWALTQNLTLFGSIAYLDATYDNFTGATCTIPQNQDPVNNPGCLLEDGTNIVTAGQEGGQDLGGETLLFAPEWSGALSINHMLPLDNGMMIQSTLDLNYSDEYFSALDLDPSTKHDSYVKVNARIALMDDEAGWTLAILGKNLTNEETNLWKNDVTLTDSNSYFGVPQRPRSIAIQAGYKF